MFGRVRRVSCSSADEVERPTSKLFKHDSLSIYESTLLKLKLGSQHSSSCPNEALHPEDDSMATEDDSDPVIPTLEEPMAVDDDASASTSSNCHNTSTTKQYPTRQLSVAYLFSRFKSSKDASSPDKRMNMENNCSSSITPSSGNYQEVCIS